MNTLPAAQNLTILGILLLTMQAAAQEWEVRDPDIVPLNYLGQTVPLRDYMEDPDAVNEIVRDEKIGVHPKDDWPIHPKVDPNALPLGMDPALQKEYNRELPPIRAVSLNFDGQGYTNVNPPDPTMEVGPNHIIQMINAGSGAQFQIWDKTGVSLAGPFLFDNFFGLPGGLGDPIVLYDQMADRWFMSEFASTGNYLHIAITATPDPLGTWHTYIFETPEFPDYPKYGVWPDAYYVTTNESNPAVYALDRVKMLAGDSTATAQRFTIPSVPTLGFQSATPVDLEGSMLPPANTPGLIMRMVDDGWSTDITEDYLEMWEFVVDFTTPANSSLTGPDTLHTVPFDSELCGYTSFSCIEQPDDNPGPGPPNLDPLREVLMNRVLYRNFGTYQAIVCNHVTDVNGSDQAGVRWYELRRVANWNIHQQGTYAPDGDNRWMASITIDAEGSIGLAYNVSSSSTYPSLRYTGRRECDVSGMMTIPETSIVAGSASNESNRYGDYSQLSVDPSTGEFWFTGEYNPATQWSTRIVTFEIPPATPDIAFTTTHTSAYEAEADVDSACLDYKEYLVLIGICIAPSQPATVTFVKDGTASHGDNKDYIITPPEVILSETNLTDTVRVRIYDDAYVESDETLTLSYTFNANGGDATAGSMNQTHTVTIVDDDMEPSAMLTTYPVDADFEEGNEGFTSVNVGAGQDWMLGTHADASSSSWAVPDNGTGQLFFVNDDACNCDMLDVKLITPVMDLTDLTNTTLTFNSFFEGRQFHGNSEEAILEISIDGGAFSPVPGATVPAASSWQQVVADLSAYDGSANVRIAFKYSDDGGWLYGWVVDNILVSGETPLTIQTDVDTAVSDEQYLGSFETVHFFDPMTNNIVATIENTSAVDFGCTTVAIDRQGTVPEALPFNSYSPSTLLHSKTLRVTPEHDVSGAYTITMYFTSAEIAAWRSATGNTISEVSLIKVEGENAIDDVNPSNYTSFTIDHSASSHAAWGDDTTYTASFTGGFSGFGAGRFCDLLVANTSDAGDGSLRSVLGCAKDGDTIRFDTNIHGDTIVLSSDPLVLTSDIVLYSSDTENITLDASGLMRAIEISEEASVEVHGLVILSGSTISGRGVLNNGTLLIRDVKILDHPSSTEGEVLISNGTLQIEGNTNIEE